MKDKLNILFLCTGNSCRSQMAEGWTNHLKSDQINAYSAGIEIHGLNPDALEVMYEAGVDISHHTSQHLDEFRDQQFDYVITVCSHAHETCPWFPGEAKVIHAGFDDPPQMAKKMKNANEKLDCYRKVRGQIKTYIQTLPDSLEINDAKKGDIDE